MIRNVIICGEKVMNKLTKKIVIMLAAVMLCGCAEKSDDMPETVSAPSAESTTVSVEDTSLSEEKLSETDGSASSAAETTVTTVPRETTASRITKTSDDFITTPKTEKAELTEQTTEVSTVTTPVTTEGLFSTVPTMAQTELTAPPETSAAAVQSAAAPKSSDKEETVGTVVTEDEASDGKNVRRVTYSEYFENSLFVGDSICSGLKIYSGLLNVENVAARLNVSTWGINKYTFQYKTNSTDELDVYSIIKLYQPEDIYIWMGMNDLYVVDSDKFGENMCDLAVQFIKNSPESKVHVVSITPMTSWHKWNVELDGNNRVNEYNAACEEACSDQPYIDYINVHDDLINSKGYLADENDGGDGMHLSASAYKKVLRAIIEYNGDKVEASK